MADEKKPEAKPASSGNEKAEVFVELVTAFAILMLLTSIFNSVSTRLSINRLFSNGLSGFGAKTILLSHTRPIASLDNPIGARVISLNSTSVYDAPGGEKIGSHKAGSKGKILQGPVDIGGHRYWYVDYDSGQDGWVREEDIAYLETEPNIIEKSIIWFFSILSYIKWSIVILCLLVLIYVIYLTMKLRPLREIEHNLLYPVSAETEQVTNPKWEKVLSHVESLNESDWRIAVIEADIILGDLLDKLSLPGDTIGDKLKAVEKSDFKTLDDAWEAHKVRNRISHDGQTFMLNQREARTVIGQYEKVFKEFEII